MAKREQDSQSLFAAAARDLINASQSMTEHMRVVAVRKLQILDTPPEIVYDDIVALAAKVCGSPSAVLTFIDADRAFIKASVNGPVGNQRREDSFCNVAIETPRKMLIVPDARLDSRFEHNPNVLDHSVCFYAGMPMVTQQGLAIGALCVVDIAPRGFDDEQVQSLQSITRIVTRLAMTAPHITRS